MAAKVLFFGEDTRLRIPALKRAGYLVKVCGSVLELHSPLVEDPAVAAVAICGAWEPFLHDPISIVRAGTKIPFVLFSNPGEHSLQSGSVPSVFDLVVPAGRPLSQWLSELDILIRECQATLADARRVNAMSDLLSEQSQAIIARSQLARERSRLERESSQALREWSRVERERSLREISKNTADLPAKWELKEVPGIVDFQRNSSHFAVPCEERDGLNRAVTIALAKMTQHLWKIVRVKFGNGPAEEINALQAEEKRLAADLEDLLSQWEAHRASHGC